MQQGCSRRLDHVLEVASLVTERLLATDAADHSFLDAFLQGVDDLEDDKEESLVEVSIPTGGASLVEEPSQVVEEAPAEPPAPSPVQSIQPEEEAVEESDDEYGDDSYEDEEYGDDDFDDFEDESAVKGDFSEDLSIEDYLRKVFDSVDVNLSIIHI